MFITLLFQCSQKESKIANIIILGYYQEELKLINVVGEVIVIR